MLLEVLESSVRGRILLFLGPLKDLFTLASVSRAVRSNVEAALGDAAVPAGRRVLSPFDIRWRETDDSTVGEQLLEVMVDEPMFKQRCDIFQQLALWPSWLGRLRGIRLAFITSLCDSEFAPTAAIEGLRRISVDGCHRLTHKAFTSNLTTHLTHLRLFWLPSFSSTGIAAVLCAIPRRQLREVALVGCQGFDDKVAMTLCSRFGVGLSALDISRSDCLTEVGLSVILETAHDLRHFRCYGNQHIQPQAFRKLDNLRKCNHIDLCGARVNDDDLKRFLSAAKFSLQSLNLTWAVESEGMFISELAECTQLTWLSLHGLAKITRGDLQRLACLPLVAVDFHGLDASTLPLLGDGKLAALFPRIEKTSLAH